METWFTTKERYTVAIYEELSKFILNNQFRKSVDTNGLLPTGDPVGTIRLVRDENAIYSWDGTSWTSLGSSAPSTQTLQQITDNGSVTTNALIVRNNPDTYRTRYSTVGQQIQRDDLGYSINYDDIGIRKSQSGKSFTVNLPDISSNSPLSVVNINFRPNISGTVAFLSDIVSANVQFYTDTSFFPTTGIVDILYVSKDTNETYIWSAINTAYELLGLGSLQQVTSTGNSTTNDIQLNGSQLRLSNFFTNAILRANPSNESLDIGSNSNSFFASLNKQLLTANRTYSFPDKTGTFAMLSDIPATVTIQNINSNTTAVYDTLYIVNTNGGSVDITLPTAIGNQGEEILIKNVGNNPVNLITIGGQTIDGYTAYSVKYKNSYVSVFSNGTNFNIR